MYWLMICRHRPLLQELRENNRAAHRSHVSRGGDGTVKVLVGSALTDADNNSVGNFGILEASTREAVLRFAENDPFALVGLVESIEIIKLAPTFPAQMITPMTSNANQDPQAI
jgi:uncharacterized protein YciI